ncbi:hypothetical protein F0562_013919 [Nyssa sinensis]|uniref:O-fucosyltransferase family protein n=1 Tax=Nyssa sinensis TaxID=561372 RepID=A0A5J4ZPH2_9ASTE|nr:hypothetical protein F0562_013919 [Nyssa sinensis]
MDKTCFLYLLSVFLVQCFITCSGSAPMNVSNYTTDQSALLAFKAHITFDPHEILANNWSITTSICHWIGVSCSEQPQRVTALSLPNLGLEGTLPPHIGNLSFLVEFNISNNSFHGHLPNELAQLHHLKLMDLSFNDFNGVIPSWFGILTEIRYLLLANNSFTGFIPLSLCNMSRLESLDLGYNFLQGNIPEEIGNLRKLRLLVLVFNQLSGSIPSTIFNLSSLQFIRFSSNGLSGSLPDDLCYRLPKLVFLRLSWNELYGHIPSTLGDCRQLQSLSLSVNKFTGSIPRGIGNLTMLKELYIGYNNLEGEIPQEMGRLLSMEILTIGNAGLTGLVPSSIFNITSLKQLNLYNNNLSCSLPQDMCLHLPVLEVLLLYDNKFRGSIPMEIGNCTSLTTIDFSRNNLEEYGREGLLSTRCDVYSYGIMLMETFTRMKPTDEMFTGEMSLKHWVNESLPNAIIQIVDPNLLRPEEKHFSAKVQSVSSVMELALDCCAESPQKRINMNDVEATLRKIRLKLLANLKGSPRSPRPRSFNVDSSFGTKDYQFRCTETQPGSDRSIGRRMLGGEYHWKKAVLLHGLKNGPLKFSPCKGAYVAKRVVCPPSKSIGTKESRTAFVDKGKASVQMNDRLLNLAFSSLAEKEFKQDAPKFWEEPYPQESMWKPCADRESPTKLGKFRKSNGFILVSANGGLNQQRVAVCNAVAVASLLNATLVIPKFLYSNVWNDPSQFGDIYQEEYFINILKDEVNIVKELPPHLKSLELEAIGSLITDADISKEATPHEYVRTVLPLLLRNEVVHFLGFGNQLSFDPLPSKLQRLRCKCNFHALKFVPKIQHFGSLLVKRIRKYDVSRNMSDKKLLGSIISNAPLKGHDAMRGPSKYLALHMRELHFPLLIERLKNSNPVSPTELRKLGRCPLTPEEAALVLAGLGFKPGTYMYLVGSRIYGGQSRMHPFTPLYPNFITKENILTPSELAPFRNFSSQVLSLALTFQL